MSQLEKLKQQLGITDNTQDVALNLLLDDVRTDILIYCQRKDLPKALESAQRQLAIIRYNMEGVEGQTAHAEGGVSRSFDEDMPKPIQKVLNQNRLAKMVRYAT